MASMIRSIGRRLLTDEGGGASSLTKRRQKKMMQARLLERVLHFAEAPLRERHTAGTGAIQRCFRGAYQL
jgi:hypothetical protein